MRDQLQKLHYTISVTKSNNLQDNPSATFYSNETNYSCAGLKARALTRFLLILMVKVLPMCKIFSTCLLRWPYALLGIDNVNALY